MRAKKKAAKPVAPTPRDEWFAGFDSNDLEVDENSYGDSAPHAICLAALKAVASLPVSGEPPK